MRGVRAVEETDARLRRMLLGRRVMMVFNAIAAVGWVGWCVWGPVPRTGPPRPPPPRESRGISPPVEGRACAAPPWRGDVFAPLARKKPSPPRTKTAPASFDPRGLILKGLLIGEGMVRLVVEDRRAGKVFFLAPGERIRGAVLQSADERGAVFTSDGRRIEIAF